MPALCTLNNFLPSSYIDKNFLDSLNAQSFIVKDDAGDGNCMFCSNFLSRPGKVFMILYTVEGYQRSTFCFILMNTNAFCNIWKYYLKFLKK